MFSRQSMANGTSSNALAQRRENLLLAAEVRGLGGHEGGDHRHGDGDAQSLVFAHGKDLHVLPGVGEVSLERRAVQEVLDAEHDVLRRAQRCVPGGAGRIVGRDRGRAPRKDAPQLGRARGQGDAGDEVAAGPHARQVLAEPARHRLPDGLLDGELASVDVVGRPVANHELHRPRHRAPSEAFGALAGDQQRLVDVVVGHGAQLGQVHPVQRDGDRLHQRVADGVRMTDPLALDHLDSAARHRLDPQGLDDNRQRAHGVPALLERRRPLVLRLPHFRQHALREQERWPRRRRSGTHGLDDGIARPVPCRSARDSAQCRHAGPEPRWGTRGSANGARAPHNGLGPVQKVLVRWHCGAGASYAPRRKA